MESRKLAIFDIDGTIFRSSLLVELIHELVRRNVFPDVAYEEMEQDYLAWMNRKGSYENYIDKLIAIRNKYLKGCRFSDIDQIAREVVWEQKDIVYRFTRDLVIESKSKNYFLLAISGSPIFMVEKFAINFGFDAVYGNIFEVKNGKFTGNIAREAVYSKDKILQEFLRSHKKKKVFFDLENAIAVGDTEGDIPILESVGNPIVFNPNQGLVKCAKERGWTVVVERKDVIYRPIEFEFNVKGGAR